MTDQTPIRQLLGVSNAANPFEVLGLPVGVVSDSDIVDALSRRMKVVADHPFSETPEGNEVRLALHAAAAQLLDPRIRNALYERAGVLAAPRARAPIAAGRVLGPRAMMIIASEGGWNIRALRRLAMIAHAEGIPSTAIPQAIRGIVGDSRPQQNEPETEPRRGRRPRIDRERTKRDTIGTWATAGAVVAAVAVLAATWGVLKLRVDPPTTTEANPTGSAAVADPTAGSPDIGPIDEPVADGPEMPEGAAPIAADEPDWSAAIIGLRDAREAMDADTAAQILSGWAKDWPSADARGVGRTVAAFVDVVYAMDPREAERFVAMTADQLRDGTPNAAAAHAGVLTRLSIERSLPTAVDNAIVASLVSTVGVSSGARGDPFVRGAAAGLRRAADSWPETPPGREALAEWLASADAVTGLEPEIGSLLVRTTVQDVLRGGQDPLSDQASLRLVNQLCSRLAPGASAEDAGLVLTLLGDESVSTRAVSTMLNALARQGVTAPPGESVRLAPTASESERAALRQRLADTWTGAEQATEDSDRFADAISAHLRAGHGVTAAEHLADAVVSARLIGVAKRTFWATPVTAPLSLQALRSDIDQILDGSGGAGSTQESAAQQWAVRYLEAERNIPVRLSLLGELVQRPRTLGTIAAEVVMAEAVHGSPARVRREAQAVIQRAADQPSVINAALEILPTAPRVRSVQQIIETISQTSLPPIDDPAWPIEARRAIVDRLLVALAGEGERAKLDRLAELLVAEVADALGRSGSTYSDPAELASDLVQDRLAELRRIDLAGSAAKRVDEILRLLAGRRSMTEGSAMRFAAFQVAATELLAEIIRLEHPHQSDLVGEVLSTLAAERADAGSVFEQMAVTERASLRLWAVRIGVEP